VIKQPGSFLYWGVATQTRDAEEYRQWATTQICARLACESLFVIVALSAQFSSYASTDSIGIYSTYPTHLSVAPDVPFLRLTPRLNK